jgi:hypothetical protein
MSCGHTSKSHSTTTIPWGGSDLDLWPDIYVSLNVLTWLRLFVSATVCVYVCKRERERERQKSWRGRVCGTRLVYSLYPYGIWRPRNQRSTLFKRSPSSSSTGAFVSINSLSFQRYLHSSFYIFILWLLICPTLVSQMCNTKFSQAGQQKLKQKLYEQLKLKLHWYTAREQKWGPQHSCVFMSNWLWCVCVRLSAMCVFVCASLGECTDQDSPPLSVDRAAVPFHSRGQQCCT